MCAAAGFPPDLGFPTSATLGAISLAMQRRTFTVWTRRAVSYASVKVYAPNGFFVAASAWEMVCSASRLSRLGGGVKTHLKVLPHLRHFSPGATSYPPQASRGG
jgi:hypothetical protein